MTNTYDAQFGRTGGGTVNTTLKSGSNTWHGTAFDYVRTRFSTATSRRTAQRIRPGKHITHQFGGTVGGTLRKDKDFVFLRFEGFGEIVPFPVITDSPPRPALFHLQHQHLRSAYKSRLLGREGHAERNRLLRHIYPGSISK